MGSDSQRAKVYNTVKDNWGEEAAETVMAALPPWDHADVALQSHIENLRVAIGAKLDQIDARFSEVDARFTQVDARFDRIEAKIDAQFSRLVAFLLPLMVALVGLVVALT